MAERRGSRWLVALALGAAAAAPLAVTVAGPTATAAATPAAGTVSGDHSVAWDFAPVGGPTGSSDSFKLTVQLPTDAARWYAPESRDGSVHAAVLRVVQTWTGSDPTQALSMSATDQNGNPVGSSTLGVVNDGSDVAVLTMQDPIIWDSGGAKATYTANTVKDAAQDFVKDTGAGLSGCCWTQGMLGQPPQSQWTGATVTVAGEPPMTVASSTEDTLTLKGSWPTVPKPGTPYTVSFGDHQTFTITASNGDGFSTTPMASHAVATLQLVDLAAHTPPATASEFANYHIPLSLMPETLEEQQVLDGRAFGEPSIGVDPRTDAVMYQAGLYTIRATFGSGRSAPVSWTDVSDAPLTNTASEDAILDVDRATGRTIVSQLTAVCSLSAVSDDDGATWTPAAKPCETPPAVDHQTIGAGPFHAPVPATAYPDALYYCSQNVVLAECALSLDGGITYGAGSPLWTSAQCFGLHGHVKVAPDGTVYVPNKACGAPECLIVTSTAGPNCHPGFAVSEDNGATWTVHTIADGHSILYDGGDPSIGIGAAGTMYFGYVDRSGHPKIAVCKDAGTTCGASVDVGTAYGIANTEMPAVVAGDDDRAAFAFLGSTMPGNDQDPNFVGTWHVYVATTYDGGRTWTITDATPDQPVQRGCIEFAASCPSTRAGDDQRNLLDFNDLTVDREGRILYAYTDGCASDLGVRFGGHGACLQDPTRLSGLDQEIEGPAIARQTCGKGLYARLDAQAVPCGAPAGVQAASTPAATPAPTAAATPAAAPVAIPNTSAPPPGGALPVAAPLALAGMALATRRRRWRR